MTDKPRAFTRANRVRKRPEFLAIYKRCRPMHTAHLVFYAQSGDGEARRLGCTVPKKVGCSVVRNRLKRRIREVFRLNREALPEGCTLIVNAKRTAGSLKTGEIASAMTKIAERLSSEGYPQ